MNGEVAPCADLSCMCCARLRRPVRLTLGANSSGPLSGAGEGRSDA